MVESQGHIVNSLTSVLILQTISYGPFQSPAEGGLVNPEINITPLES